MKNSKRIKEEIEILKGMLGLSIEEQIKNYKSITGKSQSSFYRIRKRLKTDVCACCKSEENLKFILICNKCLSENLHYRN